MSFVNQGISHNAVPADMVSAAITLRERVDRGELERMDATELAEFERELDSARQPLPLPFDHPHAQAIAYCYDALRTERSRRDAEQTQRTMEAQYRMERARKLIFFATKDGEAIAHIVDEDGMGAFGAPQKQPTKVSAKAAASMTDDELNAALREARAVVLDQKRINLPKQAESLHELARVSAAVADHLSKLAKEHEACHGIATRNAATIEKELASRADERAKQEAARAELEANLPAVVAELQRQIDELRAKGQQQ